MTNRPSPSKREAPVASSLSLWAPIWLTMVASIGSIFVILWFDFQAAKIEQEKFEQSSKLLAIGLSSSVENPVILRDYAELEARLKLALSDAQVVSAVVTDDKGHVLSYVERAEQSGPSPIYAERTIVPPSVTSHFEQTGSKALLWTPIGSKRTVGYMRLEFRVTKAEMSLRSLRKTILVLSLAGATLMIGLLSLLTKRLRDLFKAREENLIAAHSELMDVAYYDSLTGLPNRRLFKEFLSQEIARCERTGGIFAVVFCDLDDFKEVNDALGHDAGDELLVGFARHLLQTLRQSDTVARFGGDEFVLLLRDISSRTQCEEIMDRVMAFPEPLVHFRGRTRNSSLSAGIALYPEDSKTEQSLLGNADKAMYAAKRAGGNIYSFHDASLATRVPQPG